MQDFAPIALALEAEGLLVVHPSVPAQSVAELIALARAKPGTLTFASAGMGTASHLAGELFKTMAKVDMVHVPYKGNVPALTDLLAGQTVADLRHHAHRAAAREDGQAACARDDRRDAIGGGARAADGRGSGPAGVRGDQLGRSLRAGRHATRDRPPLE